VLAGPSAAYRYGIEHAARFEDPVHVIVPRTGRVGPRQGMKVHVGELEDGDTDCTGPARTAWDLAVWLDVVQAVTIIDALLGRGCVTTHDLQSILGRNEGGRGHSKARRAFRLADGRAQSPPESQLRVKLVMAGLPVPTPQHPVKTSGGTLHPDLAWPDYQVALEYDGHWHAAPDQLHRDRRRLNHLANAGWIVLHVTSERLRRDFAGIAYEVRKALESRGWHP
jgi:very-short-patch-repair endonuclease